MSVYPYCVAGWLVLIGAWGIMRSRNLIHAVVCLSVAQSGTYLLLLAVGFQRGAAPPIFAGPNPPPPTNVVDPVVQAMTLTDIVIQATVTALLLALVIQIHKRHGTVDPDELSALKG
ncbi:sodium:proton antiporter [Mycobacterium kyorinense]|uniref:Dehydrogenase n=1 Tax=Mycobacterium kyorinense TaxID=487514 RepID=A0A1X1YCA5_9MYCO|nr:cation:proton antiporter subunit C [Mycobacterium kyorinense]ORW08630.1 dehydrogenase [Mycobacterium kyorinense]